VSPLAITYPPTAPTLSGDVLTISRFLSSPTAVSRRLRTIAENRFIADVLLSGRIEGSSILYETDESIYTADAPEIVAPGAQYPRTLAPTGTASVANPVKWGQEVPITDEEVGRFRGQAVERNLAKIVNYLVLTVDSTALAVISTAVTATLAASAAWNVATANPILDLLRAKATVRQTNKGYEPDTAACDDFAFAYIVGNMNVLATMAREAGTTVSMSGDLPVLAGLRILPTPNLPAAGTVLVLDSNQLGSLGYENIPSPEYQGPADGIQTLTRRDPEGNDSWLVRARRPVVPFVQEPGAACKITGIGTLT
jgi:hypothetical protein